jgi:hypothetical protein
LVIYIKDEKQKTKRKCKKKVRIKEVKKIDKKEEMNPMRIKNF